MGQYQAPQGGAGRQARQGVHQADPRTGGWRAKGGPLVEDNPRLRAAVDKALGANMTRDTIDRAIARGAGNNDADDVEELTYEGYAPGGVAILVEA
jgi:hypothetical protein